MALIKEWIDVVSVRKLISLKAFAYFKIKTIHHVIGIYSIVAQVGISNMAAIYYYDALPASKPNNRCAIQL